MFNVRVVEAPGTFKGSFGTLDINGRSFSLVGTRPYTTVDGIKTTAEVGVASYIIDEPEIGDGEIKFVDDEGGQWEFEIIEEEDET